MRPQLRWQALAEYFTPPSLLENPEAARRARLVTGFGITGGIFGPIYAIFYLLIGHVWGAAIIVVCTLGMGMVPWLLKKTGSLTLTGNLHAFILALGFSGLTAIEGGVDGHAIAWLASVPLCVLLLVGTRAAQVWCGICFLVVLFFCVLEGLHITAPILYPSNWHATVTAAGFLGLVIFMSVIGLIFELGRKRAFGKMQDALQELSRSNTRLIELDKEKSEILGVAAHDLRNPLNEIMGFARLIVDTKATSVGHVKEDAGAILRASTQMYDLVSDLLDIHAIEDGYFYLKKETIDLVERVSAAVEGHVGMAERKQITLDLQCPAQEVMIQADRGAVFQVMNNLISNAIKFSPAGRTVFVRVKAEGGSAVVEVQDQGPGISPEDRARLFAKFARLSAQPTGGETSTGLGLSIVKRLAELMGGTVECRSELGAGATFVLRFASVSLPEIAGGGGEEIAPARAAGDQAMKPR